MTGTSERLRGRQGFNGSKAVATTDARVSFPDNEFAPGDRRAALLPTRRQESELEKERRIGRSLDFMMQHLHKPIQVPILSAIAGMSVSHFSFLFKRATGCAPIEYFIRARMRRACELLEETTLNVKEVAASMGYDDPFYFSRLFKSVNGLAPREYRNVKARDGRVIAGGHDPITSPVDHDDSNWSKERLVQMNHNESSL
jgi:transcriptional regulator GlxA family with amidase domain